MTWAASVCPRLLGRAAWPLRSLVRMLMPVIMPHVALVRLLALVRLVTLICPLPSSTPGPQHRLAPLALPVLFGAASYRGDGGIEI